MLSVQSPHSESIGPSTGASKVNTLEHTFAHLFMYFFFFFTFYNCIVPMGFLPWEIRVAFPRGSQLRQSRATQPTVHAGCFRVYRC